jgi:hypothetical protein
MFKTPCSVLKTQSGVALVIALIMMVVLTVIGLASTFTSSIEAKLSGNKRGSTDAFYAADSGVQVILARIENFNLPGNYEDNKYKPFTNPVNPNPTNADVTISFDPNQHGAPRGTGTSAINFEFGHYMVESTGQDQIAADLIKARCTVQQKVVRLIPTMQGGY